MPYSTKYRDRKQKLSNEMTHQPETLFPGQRYLKGFADYANRMVRGEYAKQGLFDLSNTLNMAMRAQTPEEKMAAYPELLNYFGAGITTMIKPLRGEPVRMINEIRSSTKPKLVKAFHSTDQDFMQFDPERGIGGQMWFTSRKDLAEKGYEGARAGRLVEAEIDIRNPAGWDEYDKFSLDELMAQGYDGLKLTEDGEDVWVAFFPEQVKVLSNKPVNK